MSCATTLDSDELFDPLGRLVMPKGDFSKWFSQSDGQTNHTSRAAGNFRKLSSGKPTIQTVIEVV